MASGPASLSFATPFFLLTRPLHSPRLRDVLAEKERECQALVQQALQRVNGEARICALASEPPGEWHLAGEH